MNPVEIESALRTFVVESFLFGDESAAPARDASFLQSRVVDSTGVLELVAFVEERFGFKVGEDELTPDNFDSIAKLTKFVTQRTT